MPYESVYPSHLSLGQDSHSCVHKMTSFYLRQLLISDSVQAVSGWRLQSS